ncbi:SSL2 DNA or RNA helicases of superfamily II [uncultured Caudovirales phage]|uniref:SSL2 DNA or RNA helicases of superfamily II n=1 Tax=uncultured Caudovirales phage TaxID=2100421 RepID=A0A6J5PD50_9CAUD|nr:SSL2 DNA or RNA helicases of superfamily II [uncultured Caudovirales phage]CAB4170925.1 SSL2 DNA or RNA helicases of superfamily II [uncultured Caudovirales phage]CAB4177154.1 SSL2 DNA or RNA helicases of superfamily II [uncultured Caudovirales phage]CAB4223056.1 SSL2 DNA or RNA helicases of superfamily II [uncultured Caudovirales phage]
MKITIEKINEVHIRVTSDDKGIEKELESFFTYEFPGARYTPAFRARLWDGLVRMYNTQKNTLYVGLLDYVIEFAKRNGYTVELLNDVNVRNGITSQQVADFAKNLNPYGRGAPIEIRDYQIDAVTCALDRERVLLLSPTASGKSFIIYTTLRWHLNQNRKCIIIVPTTSLVEQLYTDFEDYSTANGFNVGAHCQKLYSGFSKVFDKDVLITTWQSIFRQDKAWFSQFDVIFGDEAHQFKANSLTSVMDKMENVKYRIGTTGTIDNKKVHKLVLEGIFGPLHRVTTTKALMDSDRLAKLNITSVILRYDEPTCKNIKGSIYQDEIDFIISHERRNKFISNLALTCTGNTLVLFQYVERHGKILHDIIASKAHDGRKIFFVHGGVSTEVREEIRLGAEDENDAIIVASFGTFSTGINLPSIENVIFASPSKSKIRNLQSIGRGLRLKAGKAHCNLYDIADNLSYKKWTNHTLKHAAERYKIYAEEEFEVKLVEIKI